VPAGHYFSVVKKLVPRVKEGKVVLDAFYEIRQPRGSSVYHIKQSYPEGSSFLQDFYNAMIAAGVKPGPNLKDAIGVEEFIALAYVSTKSDFGSIVKRYPKAVALAYYGHSDETADTEEDDDEFDDDFGEYSAAGKPDGRYGEGSPSGDRVEDTAELAKMDGAKPTDVERNNS
jgi:hypothetical protein